MKDKLVTIVICLFLILSVITVAIQRVEGYDEKNVANESNLRDTKQDGEYVENSIQERGNPSETKRETKHDFYEHNHGDMSIDGRWENQEKSVYPREKSLRTEPSKESSSISLGATESENYSEVRDPIRIDSNDDLADKAEDENWVGNGSENDPYIIKGYEIDGGGHGYSIYIGNVTHHFEVYECRIYNTSGGEGEYFNNNGIHLFNTSNGKIQDNIISRNSQSGIYFSHVENSVISNNTIYSNEGHEVQIEESDNIEVLNNRIQGEKHPSDLLSSRDNAEYSKDSIMVQLRSPDDDMIKKWGEERALKFTTDEIANTVAGITSRIYPTFNMAEISLEGEIGVKNAVESLVVREEVIHAEPNYIMETTATPNDPGYDSLWAMPTIDAPNAWDITTGSEEVVVAVIDSGIDYNHPDLKDNMWTSEEGHHGYNAINNSYYPMDDTGHGTHVAGTIGAVGNNDLGVVGVNWNVSLMAVKFLGETGTGTVGDAIAGLEYVLERKRDGENIVATSNSWGGTGFSELLYEAIEKHQQEGISFVAAAGNNRADVDKTPFYPANYDLTNIISVAATDENDELAEFSNYGKRSIHVGAPGVNINSTVLDGQYDYASGTSMAVPHVSGLIALLRSHHPTYDHNQLKNVILSSSDQPNTLQNLTLTEGRINAYQALELSPDPENIRLWVHRPTSEIPWGEKTPISVSLNDGVNPIKGANVSVEFSTGEDTVYLEDDGSGGDQSGDGYYTGEWIPLILGEVELHVTAEMNDGREIMKNVTVTVRGDSGIALLESDYNLLSLNNVTKNYYGISLYNSQSNELKNNILRENQEGGIRLYESDNNELENHTISYGEKGVSFERSNENFILNSTISDNYDGLFFDSSHNNTILGNTVSKNDNHGIWLDHSNNTKIIDNEISNNYNGILLERSNNTEIKFNTVSKNGANGIWLDYSHRNEITANIVSNNMFRGIDLHRSNHTYLGRNTISNSTTGMDIARSKSAVITNNTLINDSINIWGSRLSWWDTHSIDTSNTVNGNPVYYWKNKTQRTVPLGAGQVLLVNCTDIIVENQNVSDGSIGILFGFSDNNTVVNNTVLNNDKGIRLFKSNYNTIVGNTASNSTNSWFTLSYAIWISRSNYNEVVENTLLNNDGHSIYLSNSNKNFIANNIANNNRWRALQLLGSHGNTLSNNIASDSRYGIAVLSASKKNILMENNISDNNRSGLNILFQSNDNHIKKNTISRNRDGIHIWESMNNTIAKNKIIENEVQAWDNGDNDWDAGDPADIGEGGNYWSDYEGRDRGDGIGDEPYLIEGNENQDSFPWMSEDMLRYEEDKNILDIILDWIDFSDFIEKPNIPEREEIPGFTSVPLIIASIISVLIYRKKKER